MIIPRVPKNHSKRCLVVKKVLLEAKSWVNRHVNSVVVLLRATLEFAQMKSLFPSSSLWQFSSKKEFKGITIVDWRNCLRTVRLNTQVLITSANQMEINIKLATLNLLLKSATLYIDINKTETQYSWTDNLLYCLCLSEITRFKSPRQTRRIRLI